MPKPKPNIQADHIQIEILALRKESGLSRETVAHMAGITINTAYRMEKGRHHSSIYFVNLYLNALGKKLKIVDMDECQ